MIASNNLLIPPSYVSHSCPIIDLGGLNCMSSLLSGMSSGAKNIGQIINIMRSCQNRLKSIGDKRPTQRSGTGSAHEPNLTSQPTPVQPSQLS